MTTETLVQNNHHHHHHHHNDQLSSISLMLEYDIDNTLNTIRENNQINNLKKNINQNVTVKNHEINNNCKIESSLSTTTSPPPPSSPSTSTSSSLTATTSLCKINNQTNARKRWKILAKVLRKDTNEQTTPSSSSSSSTTIDDDIERTTSVRRFKTFNLLQQNNFEDTIALNLLGKEKNWFTYKICLNHINYSVNIHHIDHHLTANDLIGFNNTGNICVWPSEEALTVYVLSELNYFHNKWILELGGGMTCLTGLMLAKYAKPYICNLTDGNHLSIDNVKKTICLNELSCYTKCSVLKWENFNTRLITEYEKFDVILTADCLFFDNDRKSLVDTIWYYLSKNGIAFVMAPKRGNTMKLFLNDCKQKGFLYQIIYCYNDIIWERHLELKNSSNLYDEDIHYPVLLKLTKN